MTGVLFVICIPRERYEKCMENTVRNTTTIVEEIRTAQATFSSGSSDDSSDSSDGSVKKSFVERLKQEEVAVNIPEDEIQIDAQYQPDENEGLVRGSMDSDEFARAVERKKEKREQEEAIEKFFNTSNERSIIDKMLMPMEYVLREIIIKMEISNVSWKKINSSNFYKITFCLEKGTRCDETIHLLSEYGIGQKKGSSIAIIPCTLYDDKVRSKNKERERTDREGTKETDSLKDSSWNRFIGTVRARLNVAKIVEAVKSDASLTFDFIILLIVASMLASFGLVENSTLFLAASMLISPLMGPILAATFGTAIKDHKLQFWGLKNEIIGVFMCIFVGFIFGVCSCLITYNSGEDQKLTQEILSRCNFHSVFVGICIALVSGAAQSIALLRNNVGSLVGVAISASLLPPAVNTGLLWSYSCVLKVSNALGKDFSKSFVETTTFSDDQATELIILGSISLLVTLTNVLSVYLMGYIFLRLKIEVTPLLSNEERQFWKHDVPIARDYNKTLNADDGKKLKEELMEFCDRESDNFKGVGAELLRQDFYHDQTQTWSPLSHRYHQDVAKLKDLDVLFKNRAAGDKHKGIYISKKSDPIDTCKPSTSNDYHKTSSSDATSHRHITFMNILSSSNDDDDGPKSRFVVERLEEENFM